MKDTKADDKVWIPPNYPPFLETIARDTAESIQALLPDIKQADVYGIALSVSEEIRAKHGGFAVYIPSGYFFDCTEKDKKIWKEFRGNNMPELAHKHNVSVARIRQIVRAMRFKDMAERQGRLV